MTSSNDVIAKAALRDLDLHFQSKNAESLNRSISDTARAGAKMRKRLL